jgi:uncharacterized protein DUF6494
MKKRSMSVFVNFSRKSASRRSEIEQAVRSAVSSGRLKGNEALPAKVRLSVEEIGLAIEIEGAIELE